MTREELSGLTGRKFFWMQILVPSLDDTGIRTKSDDPVGWRFVSLRDIAC